MYKTCKKNIVKSVLIVSKRASVLIISKGDSKGVSKGVSKIVSKRVYRISEISSKEQSD